ncbi:hypothetical protein FOL47_009290 [Perkinsus chesapeaki]|uniref:ATP-dependent DNA helicase n=1 Tax=Perkinsus chesapeaki TaxID=330153 RepID=A0A7J6MU06_PERCH|nr:hypothetical protein FOL47_009290 [Perkinsus chesapeaki]
MSSDQTTQDHYQRMVRNLDEQQTSTLMEILRDIKQGSAKNGVHHLVTGVAGSGKSHILRCLTKALELGGYSVYPIAINALASNVIDGSTFMHFFALKFDHEHGILHDNSYFRSPSVLAERMRQGLVSTKRLKLFSKERKPVIIFDEITTCHSSILEALDIFLRTATGESDYFGGVSIVLGGDCLQLRGPQPLKHGVYQNLEIRAPWDSPLLRERVSLKIYYLQTFHRGLHMPDRAERPGRRGRRPLVFTGHGPDVQYLQLLKEMRHIHLRSAGTNVPPKLSEESMQLVAKLMDREGSHETGWTGLCIYKSRVAEINRLHLNSNNNEAVTFKAFTYGSNLRVTLYV